jgi:hypothetical protein
MIIRVPEEALKSPTLRRYPERMRQFAILCDVVAARKGVYHAGEAVALLQKGQAALSYAELGGMWEVTESMARRAIEAMKKDGLVRIEPGVTAAVPGEPKSPASNILTVTGLE